MKRLIVLLFVAISIVAYADDVETVNVPEPGKLNLALLDVGHNIKNLKLVGQLNNADVKYLRDAVGYISSLEELDLSEVTFAETQSGEEPYASKSVVIDDGLFTTHVYSYFLSATNNTIYRSSDNVSIWNHKGYADIYNNELTFFLGESNLAKTLKKIVLPSSINNIGYNSLAGTALEEVTFNSPLLCIGSEAFSGSNIKTINGDLSQLEIINSQAFYNCSSLIALSNLTHLSTIGSGAFKSCTALKTIGNLSTVTSIGKEAFYGCESFVGNADNNTLDLSQYDSIQSYAFAGCSALNKVLLSAQTTFIGDNAFSSCSSLIEIECPELPRSFSLSSFKGTPWLDNLPVENNVIYWGKCALGLKNGLSSPSSIIIKEGTEYIADDFANALNYSYGQSRTSTIQNITNIVFPSSLKKIGNYAFGVYDTSNYNYQSQNGSPATELTLPEGVVEVGDYAFTSFTKVNTLVLPSTLSTIGEWAFANCRFLSMNIHSSVKHIGKGAFCRNPNLLRLSYDPLADAESNVFSYCEALTEVTIGKNCSVVSESLFSGCGNISSITFEDRNGAELVIDHAAFSGNAISSINLPVGTKSIGSEAFRACTNLEELIIPEGVESVGEKAFNSCTNLKEIVFPSTMISIGSFPFEGCDNLTTITCLMLNPTATESELTYNFIFNSGTLYVPSGKSTVYKNTAGWKDIFNRIKELLVVGTTFVVNNNSGYYQPLTYMITNEAQRTVQVGNGTDTAISEYVSFGITIPEIVNDYKVTGIGDNAFKGCSRMPHVVLPGTIKSIGSQAFSGCTNLQVLKSKITNPFNLSNNVFDDTAYNRLKVIVKEGSLAKYQNTDVWKDFSNLSEGDVKGYGEVFTTNISDGVSMTFLVIDAGNNYVQVGNGKSIAIAENTEGILDIPASVNGYTITKIGTESFHNATNIESVIIPESVTSIEFAAFEDCNSLTSVYFPASMTYLSTNFNYCENLTNLVVAEGNTKYDSRNNCNAVIKKDGDILIQGSRNTIIPKGVKTIGEKAFCGVYKEGELIIPDGVTEIGGSAFEATMLESVTIPQTVTSIGSKAFSTTSNSGPTLYKVKSYITEPYDIDSDVFGLKETAYLYVPQGTTSKYSNKKGWNKFYNIIAFESENNIEAAVLNTAPIALDCIYDGTAQELITAGIVEGGTILYSLDGENYSSTIPKGTDAKEYKVYYKVIGDENHTDIAPTFINVEITPKTVSSPVITLSETRYIYDGTAKEPTVTVMDGESTITEEEYTVSYSNNTEVGTATVTIMSQSGKNYQFPASGVIVNYEILREIANLFSNRDMWAGYVAAEDLTLPTGLTAYTITALGNTSATATSLDYIPKDLPVLLKRSDTDVSTFLLFAGTGSEPSSNLLEVYATDKKVSNREGYVLFKDEFVLVNAGTLPAGRIFLPVNSENASMTRGIEIEGEGTTGIRDCITDSENSDGQWYDLMGRKLDKKPSKRGIYILNGRIVVVK